MSKISFIHSMNLDDDNVEFATSEDIDYKLEAEEEYNILDSLSTSNSGNIELFLKERDSDEAIYNYRIALSRGGNLATFQEDILDNQKFVPESQAVVMDTSISSTGKDSRWLGKDERNRVCFSENIDLDEQLLYPSFFSENNSLYITGYTRVLVDNVYKNYIYVSKYIEELDEFSSCILVDIVNGRAWGDLYNPNPRIIYVEDIGLLCVYLDCQAYNSTDDGEAVIKIMRSPDGGETWYDYSQTEIDTSTTYEDITGTTVQLDYSTLQNDTKFRCVYDNAVLVAVLFTRSGVSNEQLTCKNYISYDFGKTFGYTSGNWSNLLDISDSPNVVPYTSASKSYTTSFDICYDKNIGRFIIAAIGGGPTYVNKRVYSDSDVSISVKTDTFMIFLTNLDKECKSFVRVVADRNSVGRNYMEFMSVRNFTPITDPGTATEYDSFYDVSLCQDEYNKLYVVIALSKTDTSFGSNIWKHGFIFKELVCRYESSFETSISNINEDFTLSKNINPLGISVSGLSVYGADLDHYAYYSFACEKNAADVWISYPSLTFYRNQVRILYNSNKMKLGQWRYPYQLVSGKWNSFTQSLNYDESYNPALGLPTDIDWDFLGNLSSLFLNSKHLLFNINSISNNYFSHASGDKIEDATLDNGLKIYFKIKTTSSSQFTFLDASLEDDNTSLGANVRLNISNTKLTYYDVGSAYSFDIYRNFSDAYYDVVLQLVGSRWRISLKEESSEYWNTYGGSNLSASAAVSPSTILWGVVNTSTSNFFVYVEEFRYGIFSDTIYSLPVDEDNVISYIRGTPTSPNQNYLTRDIVAYFGGNLGSQGDSWSIATFTEGNRKENILIDSPSLVWNSSDQEIEENILLFYGDNEVRYDAIALMGCNFRRFQFIGSNQYIDPSDGSNFPDDNLFIFGNIYSRILDFIEVEGEYILDSLGSLSDTSDRTFVKNEHAGKVIELTESGILARIIHNTETHIYFDIRNDITAISTGSFYTEKGISFEPILEGSYKIFNTKKYFDLSIGETVLSHKYLYIRIFEQAVLDSHFQIGEVGIGETDELLFNPEYPLETSIVGPTDIIRSNTNRIFTKSRGEESIRSLIMHFNVVDADMHIGSNSLYKQLQSFWESVNYSKRGFFMVEDYENKPFDVYYLRGGKDLDAPKIDYKHRSLSMNFVESK